MGGLVSLPPAESQAFGGGKTKRKAKAAPATSGDPDKIKMLVDQLRAELDAYAGYVIRKIRIELVKAVAAARQKRIEAGEEIEEIQEGDLIEQQ